MKIVALKEEFDMRVSIVPDSVRKLNKIEELEVIIEKDFSEIFNDDDYIDAGAKILSREKALEEADIILTIFSLPKEDLQRLRKGTLCISFLDLFNDPNYLEYLQTSELSSISLDMIPRTTLAQKMDAVSSQASLAGYAAVIAGSERMNKIFPMMMTPSGTIKPAKVFVIGAGVAGLQAIATAKRLGASVTAFDTRPAVKEQVESLGAKFLVIDLGDTGETDSGYAKELTKSQLEMQQVQMAEVIHDSDLVITTAKLFGRKAPIIINKNVVKDMKKGSVIVDLAASTGGNVEGTILNEIIKLNGVTIIGEKYLEARVSKDASIMFSNNMVNLLTHFWNEDEKCFDYKEDEILKGCLVTKNGVLVNEKLKEIYGG